VTLCFAVFCAFLIYRFVYYVQLLLLFMKEVRILKILSHLPYPENPVKKLIYPEHFPEPKNKSDSLKLFLSRQTVPSNLD